MNKIREKLFALTDEEYKNFNQKSCPDTKRKMLGIRVPQIRKLAKELLKENDIQDILNIIQDEYFEEVLLQGFVIGYLKQEFNDKKQFIEKFIPKIDSWAITDSFVPSLKIHKKDLEEAWSFILPYMQSDQEFDIRFAIIMMLDYFIIDEYVDKVLMELDKIKHDGYYVKMGVAWIIAEIAVNFYDKIIEYLKNNNLDKFTHNKAIQKMIESCRMSDEQKEYLRIQKRK